MIVYTFKSPEKRNAGPKAPADINAILNKYYNAKIVVFSGSIWSKVYAILSFISARLKRETVVVQHPFVHKPVVFKLFSRKRLIIFVHDVEGLRYYDNAKLESEIKIFNRSNHIIVHNNAMREYLVEHGVPAGSIYTNEIFDYLCGGEMPQRNGVKGEPRIAYAGNLVRKKSPFLYHLDTEKMKFQLKLYGLGVNGDINSKEIYMGSYTPELLPGRIDADFGLVWDGDYEEADESEACKNYTKYNNPHKVSCYLAAGLPVIVWRKAAISKFVEENNVGYSIANIYDINNLDYADYAIKARNAAKVGEKLRNGYYTRKVMDKVLKDAGGCGASKPDGANK